MNQRAQRRVFCRKHLLIRKARCTYQILATLIQSLVLYYLNARGGMFSGMACVKTEP